VQFLFALTIFVCHYRLNAVFSSSILEKVLFGADDWLDVAGEESETSTGTATGSTAGGPVEESVTSFTENFFEKYEAQSVVPLDHVPLHMVESSYISGGWFLLLHSGTQARTSKFVRLGILGISVVMMALFFWSDKMLLFVHRLYCQVAGCLYQCCGCGGRRRGVALNKSRSMRSKFQNKDSVRWVPSPHSSSVNSWITTEKQLDSQRRYELREERRTMLLEACAKTEG